MADAPAESAAVPPPAETGRNSQRLSREQQAKLLVQLLEDLQVDSGDIVVFDRACTSMNLYGGAICVCAKFFGQTQWDHNGVVIRDRSQSETSAEALYLLEATLTGVKMRPLVERLLRSKSNEVAVRQLQVARSSDFHDRAFAFANEVLDSPYEDRPRRMLNAGMMAPRRLERERLFDTLIDSKKELARLEIDLEHRRNMPDFERKALLKERDRVHEQYHTLVQQLSQTERSMFENELVPDAAAELRAEAKKTHKMFCSQLAANLYQHLGLLLPYPSANSYLPKHFSGNDGGDYLKLQQDATFLPEVSLRAKLEKNHAWYRQLAQEQEVRAPQNTEERMTIVRCLRRHQLFHMLSEAELMEISSKFRRSVLRDGEVVFHQGDEGEFFYIIQNGECDVFVDYDFLTKHPPSGDAAQAGTSDNAPAPVPLARRKTIALPDFQNSSSLVGNNERVLVATNGHGTAFGESALIYDTPRRATLRASSGTNSGANQVVLWRLDKASFREIMENHPSSQHSMEEQRFLKQAISEHPLFSDLDDHAKFLAVKKCFPLRVHKGTSILTQGDSGDYFYLIESGKCEISRKKPKREQPLVDRVIGRGASFGEAALLYNSRRGASVRALEDTKIWCMDRASFLTITRSGSAALFKLFKNVSSQDSSTKTTHTRRDSKAETFVTDASLRRMLQVPRQRSNKIEAKLPSEKAYDRAVQLAVALLLHDASGLVNFSQFAHFHIALGASNVEHLLPEAAFRILKSLVLSDDSPNNYGNPDQAASIKLHDLPRAVRAWVNSDNADFPSDTALKTQEALYAKLLNLPVYNVGDYFVTQDDLARVFVSLLSYVSEDDPHDDQELAQAKAELLAFIAALKEDIAALRTIWRAAEFHADYVEDGFAGKQDLTFDANLKSGWISAIRHNPTGGDWEYLQPALENDQNPETNALRNPEALVKKMIAHAPSFVAAIMAGALARTACAPLERLKILMQVTPTSTPLEVATKAPYQSLTRGFINMVKISGARSKLVFAYSCLHRDVVLILV